MRRISLSIPLEISGISLTEKIIFWTIVLTPFWWLLGIQPLFYPSISALLVTINLNFEEVLDKSFPVFVLAWLAMLVVALITIILGLDEVQASTKIVAASFVTLYKGYFMIFCCIATPFLTRVRSQVITRAVIWMSIVFLAVLVIQLIMLGVGFDDAVFKPPLSKLIPGGDDSNSLLVRSAKVSVFFGIPLPRSLLHTADPPILGAFALLTSLINLNETDPLLKKIGLTGSISSLIISFSRSAWVGFIMSIILVSLFRSSRARQITAQFNFLIFLFCSSVSITVFQLIELPAKIFNSARADSSSTRDIVVQATIEAWQDKFWLGWGIIRGKVWLYEDVYLQLTSFSSYAAVLYLHGVVGFSVFCLALISTLATLFRYAVAQHENCQTAFSGFLLLCALLQATPLTWMAIYLWFFFIWVSSVLVEADQASYRNWAISFSPMW